MELKKPQGGIKELVEHNVNGLIATIGEYKSLAKLLLHIFENSEKTKTFVERSHLKIINNYTLETMVKNQVIKSNDFSSYARKYSLDRASAVKGGTLGWIEKKLVVPEFGSMMTNLEVGEISAPFKTKYGWHILFLEDKRIRNISDSIIKNKAINILKERKVQVAKKEWLTKLKDQAYIEIVE